MTSSGLRVQLGEVQDFRPDQALLAGLCSEPGRLAAPTNGCATSVARDGHERCRWWDRARGLALFRSLPAPSASGSQAWRAFALCSREDGFQKRRCSTCRAFVKAMSSTWWSSVESSRATPESPTFWAFSTIGLSNAEQAVNSERPGFRRFELVLATNNYAKEDPFPARIGVALSMGPEGLPSLGLGPGQEPSAARLAGDRR